jgi:hypothetical protein
MDLNHQQEQFSRAYVRAVATIAGVCLYEPEVDHDSIDLGFAARGGGGTLRSPRLEAQLKCTLSDVRRDEQVRYPLKLKNYDDLRLRCHVPRILIVVVVPRDVGDWFAQDEEAMVLRRCGYWRSLLGEPAVENEAKITVALPRRNVFSPAALQGMMARVSEGLLP